jgi:3-oxoacyl-[acyl-carrier protein] reductase
MFMGARKVALVTGGSRGLGREVALALGRAGYRVVVNYIKEEAQALEVVQSIGGDAIAVKADVGEMGEVKEMSRRIEKEFGRLDVLINNAGITRDSLLLRLSESDWDLVIHTNLKGCFNTVKVFAPMMVSSGGGHIVNISSYSGLRGKEGQVAYSASKAAVLGFTFSLAKELGKDNIRVNAVLPGYMPTDMGKSAGKAMEKAERQSLLGRLSDPKEVSGFIIWLVQTEGITGQVFVLDSRI